MAVYAFGREYAFALGKVSRRAIYKIFGNDAVFYYLFFAVNIFQKQIEGVYALDQSLFQNMPFFCGDYAGDGIEGEEPFFKCPVLVNSKFYAVSGELSVDLILVTQ